uniref:hypothetical protein n=1 Tax=Phocaeicola faecicola TaxID=2739389 RepID=UPI001C62A288
NHSMLKSNSLERISGELLTRSFSYSALRTYMHIPTKKLLTRNMCLNKMKMTQPNGDYTLYEFLDKEFNKQIKQFDKR